MEKRTTKKKTTKIKMTQMDSNLMTIEEAWELFIRKARVKNLSERTIKGYIFHFNVFCGYMDKEQPINSISLDTIDNYVLYLKNSTETNDITIASYMRTIRAFMYWCMENEYINKFKISIPKAEKKVKETYTDSELQRLLKKPNTKKCDFTEFRIWTFENYLLGTGNRISSALELKIDDIDFDSMNIIIRKTKNRNQCIIPLSNTLANVLKEYLQIRGGESSDYVFCNSYGERGEIRTYQQAVADYNIARNVNKTSCHLFRHTFAKNWLLNGGDIFRLQKILGHSDLSVVKEYVNMFGADLNRDFDKFNPLDNLSKNKVTIKIKK